ncbi:hypothetical protein AHiyo8_65600 [Arthrobacter sp. Hiyo8]|nr:hypothetical protein AHiyo8_65600 [Arthrobacter sp. Hiyo8]
MLDESTSSTGDSESLIAEAEAVLVEDAVLSEDTAAPRTEQPTTSSLNRSRTGGSAVKR